MLDPADRFSRESFVFLLDGLFNAVLGLSIIGLLSAAYLTP